MRLAKNGIADITYRFSPNTDLPFSSNSGPQLVIEPTSNFRRAVICGMRIAHTVFSWIFRTTAIQSVVDIG